MAMLAKRPTQGLGRYDKTWNQTRLRAAILDALDELARPTTKSELYHRIGASGPLLDKALEALLISREITAEDGRSGTRQVRRYTSVRVPE